MSRERELLQRALEAVEKTYFPSRLADELKAELQKPEPVECGWVAIVNGVLTNCWNNPELSEGTHKLLAVRIDDE
jgi:hypothetical protein